MRKIALTDQQKRDREKEEASKKILDAMNAKRGIKNLSKKEFAELIGVAPNTWLNWNNQKLRGADLWDIIEASQRAGVKINIEVSV